jgi:hypothetical protein
VPTFQGKRVSAEWKVVLEAAVDDGVSFRLNSGQRTFAEQAALYRLYQSGRGNLAAVPAHNAPHIRTGRQDHAIDVDTYAGDGIAALSRWLRKQGATLRLTVMPSEPWHGELDAADLVRLAKRLDNTHPVLVAGSRGRAVKRAQRLMRDRGLLSVTVDGVYGPATASAARRLHHAYGHAAHDHVGEVMWTILEGDHPWVVLLPGEREMLAVLEARRRSARRNGGWDKIASLHLEAAVVLKASLIEQRKRIWRAAQTSGWGKLNRRRRYQLLKHYTT